MYTLYSYVRNIFSHDVFLALHIHAPNIDRNPPKMACGCPCGGAIFIFFFSLHVVTHAIVSPYGVHLPMYNFVYGVTIRAYQLESKKMSYSSRTEKPLRNIASNQPSLTDVTKSFK